MSVAGAVRQRTRTLGEIVQFAGTGIAQIPQSTRYIREVWWYAAFLAIGRYALNTSTVTHQGTGDTILLGSANDWLFWRKVGTNKDTLTGIPRKSTFI